MRGNIDSLLSYSCEVMIDEVILALPLTAETRLKELIDRLRQMPADLRLSMEPLAGALPIRGVSFHGEVPVIEVVDRPLRHWNALTKWFEDKMLGALLLVLFAPFMMLIAALIKLDSRGPVFFVQARYGFNNKTIKVIKFRTMRTELCDPTGAARTVRNDPRLTRIGGLLRRFIFPSGSNSPSTSAVGFPVLASAVNASTSTPREKFSPCPKSTAALSELSWS